jgi:hypothetical protein
VTPAGRWCGTCRVHAIRRQAETQGGDGNGHLPLQVEDLHSRYRTRQEPALRGISFEAVRGELILVPGETGVDDRRERPGGVSSLLR